MTLQTCPLPTALTPITAVTCNVIFDQIVRIVFQRKGAVPFANEAALKVLSNWNTLIAAADSTKMIFTPIFAGATIAESEALVQGGNDNSTFNGIPEYYGEGFAPFVAQFKNLPAAQKVLMKKLSGESITNANGAAALTAFFINKNGEIIHNNLSGFPIYNFRISSVGSQGLNSPNTHTIGFALPPNWDDAMAITTPSFDPLTALVNA